MDTIQDFLLRYRREFDFYDLAARLLAQQLDTELQASGIRAIVTSRAKQPGRLESKLRQRNAKKNYQDVDDIFADIVDLAGVRVALYFPAEREEVGKIIQEKFDLTQRPKSFPEDAAPSPDDAAASPEDAAPSPDDAAASPEDAAPSPDDAAPSPDDAAPSYEKRFSGYWATHYRVHMKESSLADSQKRYSDARIEIQVASVLMHAWSEVEHDLVYKPLQGALSQDEYAILDELNGLVLAGEIALERLQRAVEARVTRRGSRFTNHYDLAAFLFETAKTNLATAPTEVGIGRVDVLFDLLKRLDIDTAESLKPYLGTIDPDMEARPLAEQIIDQILVADPSRYAVYAEVRNERERQRSFQLPYEAQRSADQHRALGLFLSNWIAIEHAIRDIASSSGLQDRPGTIPSGRLLAKLDILDEQDRYEFERLRRLRNLLVHGVDIPSPGLIADEARALKGLLSRMAESPNEHVRDAARRSLETLKDEPAQEISSEPPS